MSSRTISISMRASAIQSWMLERSASGAPNVVRDTARLHKQFQRAFGHTDGAQ